MAKLINSATAAENPISPTAPTVDAIAIFLKSGAASALSWRRKVADAWAVTGRDKSWGGDEESLIAIYSSVNLHGTQCESQYSAQ